MTRPSLLLAAASISAGAVLLLAIGRWLGWPVVGALILAAAVDVARWPRGWRPW